MNRLIRYFFQGLLLIAPLAVTVYALVVAFEFIDGLLLKEISRVLGFNIPGLGLILILTAITLVGILGSSILIRPLLIHVDSMISKAPLVKIIYTSIKDFMSAFVGKDKKFSEAVLVRVNNDPVMEKLGFITQHDLSALGISDGKVAVYMPYSFSMTGTLFIVPSSSVTPVNSNPTELMKFIITAGVTTMNGTKSYSSKSVEDDKRTT